MNGDMEPYLRGVSGIPLRFDNMGRQCNGYNEGEVISVMGWIKARTFVPIFLLATFLVASGDEAKALPVFSALRGVSCAGCHINPTGGGMRSGRGFEFGQSALPIRKAFEEVSPSLNENISFGLDHRFLHYISESKRYQGTKNTFFDMQSNLYANYHLEGERMDLDLYVAKGQTTALDSLAIWKGVFGEGTYIKIGRFVPNFGVRWDDHNVFTRSKTLFTQYYRDSGIEVGYADRNRIFSVSATNGGAGQFDQNAGKMVTTSYAMYHKGWLAGSSYYRNSGQQSGEWLAGFAGFSYRSLVFISEWQRSHLKDRISHTELRYVSEPGWQWVVAYDSLDPEDPSRAEDRRWSFGTVVVPIPFAEITVYARNNTEAPSGEQWEYMTVVHFYY